MGTKLLVDYAAADAWKQRAITAAKAEKLARQAVKAALAAMKAKGTQAELLTEVARVANADAIISAREAERVWAETTASLGDEPQQPSSKT